MAIFGFTLVAWGVACWFSGAHELPFLNLFLFDIPAAIPFLSAFLVFLGGIAIRFARNGLRDWREFVRSLQNHKKEIAIVALILAAHAFYHTPSGVMYLGSNNWDSSIHGMASYHIADGAERPIYGYNRHYIGMLIPHIEAGLNILFGKSPFYHRLINAVFFLGFLVVLYLLLRRIFEPYIAQLATALAAAVPASAMRALRYHEYPELLFWGTLSLLLAVKFTEREMPSAKSYFWYGTVLGLGFYADPQMIYFGLTGLAVLFIRDKLFFARPGILALPAGFMLGSIATFVDAFYSRGAPFGLFASQGGSPLDFLGRAITGIPEFFRILPNFLGGLYEIADGRGLVILPAIIVNILFLAALGLFLFERRTTLFDALKFKNIPAGAMLFGIHFFVVLAVFSFSLYSRAPAPYRYIFPLWPVIPAVLVVGLETLFKKKKLAVGLATGGIALFFVWGTVFFDTTDVIIKEEYWNDTMTFLEQQETEAVYANFSFCYDAHFFSKGAITGTSAFHWYFEVYPPFEDRVSKADSPQFYFLSQEDGLARSFLATVNGVGVRYEAVEGPYGGLLLKNFSPKVTERNLVNLQPEQYGAAIDAIHYRSIEIGGSATSFQLMTLRVVNTGASPWFADASTGHIELVVTDVKDNELRRQPLMQNVPAGAAVEWRVVLNSGFSDNGPDTCGIEVNGFPISQSFELSASNTDETGQTMTHDQLLEKYRDGERSASLPDFALFSGWGERDATKDWRAIYSGGSKSVIGFPASGDAGVTLDLQLEPFAYAEERQDRVIRIALLINGRKGLHPLFIDRSRPAVIDVPAHLLKPGINSLTLVFDHLEPHYRLTPDNKSIIRLKLRAISIQGMTIAERNGNSSGLLH